LSKDPAKRRKEDVGQTSIEESPNRSHNHLQHSHYYGLPLTIKKPLLARRENDGLHRQIHAPSTGIPYPKEDSSHINRNLARKSSTGPVPNSHIETPAHLVSQDSAPARKPTRQRREGVVSVILSVSCCFKMPFASVLRRNTLEEGK